VAHQLNDEGNKKIRVYAFNAGALLYDLWRFALRSAPRLVKQSSANKESWINRPTARYSFSCPRYFFALSCFSREPVAKERALHRQDQLPPKNSDILVRLGESPRRDRLWRVSQTLDVEDALAREIKLSGLLFLFRFLPRSRSRR